MGVTVTWEHQVLDFGVLVGGVDIGRTNNGNGEETKELKGL